MGRQGHKKSSGDYWQSLYPVVMRVSCKNCWRVYWARTAGNVVRSLDDPAGMEKYPYIHHLLEFEQRVRGAPVPAWLQKVATPLILWEWSKK